MIDAFLSDVISALLQLVLLFAVLRTLRGERVQRGDYALGLRALPSVLIASLVIALPDFSHQLSRVALEPAGSAVDLAMSAFMLLGLIVRIMLWVVVPSIAAEDRGVQDGLTRSLQLTRGCRWKIFGVMLIGDIVLILCLGAMSRVTDVPMAAAAAIPLFTISGMLYFVVTVFTTMLFTIMAAVSYQHLRIEKDGVEPDRVVQVFD